jgi:hypothetical protein
MEESTNNNKPIGRKKVMDRQEFFEKIIEIHAKDLFHGSLHSFEAKNITKLSQELNISRRTFYNYLKIKPYFFFQMLKKEYMLIWNSVLNKEEIGEYELYKKGAKTIIAKIDNFNKYDPIENIKKNKLQYPNAKSKSDPREKPKPKAIKPTKKKSDAPKLTDFF